MAIDPQTGQFVPDEVLEAQTNVPGVATLTEHQAPTPTDAPENKNIIGKLKNTELERIGSELVELYDHDFESQSQYRKRRSEWLKLFANTKERKSFPWEGASNVKIPVISNAVTQFQARAYEEIFSPRGIAHIVDPLGDDPTRAARLERHFNFQLTQQMPNFEQDYDAGLLQLALMGDIHRKVYWDPIKRTMVSKYLESEDFVIHYSTREIEDARRYTHKFRASLHDLFLAAKQGSFRKKDIVDLEDTADSIDEQAVSRESSKIEGINRDDVSHHEPELQRLREILEVHTWWDLDGDKIEEPYIFTIDKTTRKVIRVVDRRYKDAFGEEQVLEYFVHYRLFDNPEGYYGIGLGHKLQGIQESINSITNQVIDAGTLNNVPIAFVTRKSGLKRGDQGLYPGLIKELDGPIEDIQKHVFQFRFGPPDQTLFNMLGFLKQMSDQETVLNSELFSGQSPGANTPATTVLALVEQGVKLFGSIQKRIRRSLKKELDKLYRLNSIFLDPTQFEIGYITREDYRPDNEVMPAADPNVASKAIKIIQAQEQRNLIYNSPVANQNAQALWQADKRLYDLLTDEKYENIVPPPPPTPQGPPDLPPTEENVMILNGQAPEALPQQDHEFHLEQHDEFMKSEFAARMDNAAQSMMKKHIDQHLGFVYLRQKELEAQAAQNALIEQELAAQAQGQNQIIDPTQLQGNFNV